MFQRVPRTDISGATRIRCLDVSKITKCHTLQPPHMLLEGQLPQLLLNDALSRILFMISEFLHTPRKSSSLMFPNIIGVKTHGDRSPFGCIAQYSQPALQPPTKSARNQMSSLNSSKRPKASKCVRLISP
jgi:hypothetical protein